MNAGLITKYFIGWLTREGNAEPFPLTNYERLCYELRPGDVLLVEGRSHISEVIRTITQSTWSHSALYIGRLHDIENPIIRARVQDFYNGSLDQQLLIEGMVGKGTIVTPLTYYKKDHLRICRPRGLLKKDAERVIAYSVGKLGTEYNVRQLFDLARFLLPWRFIPKRWRSSLFEHKSGSSTQTVCSSMLAQAFQDVRFPILPIIESNKDNKVTLYKRNPKLFTPRDFDYSPYFDIIKYPFIHMDDYAPYRNLPWSEDADNGEQMGSPPKNDNARE